MKTLGRIAWLILFTLIGAIIAFVYVEASVDGKFQKWQVIGTPPDKAIKILARNYVETQSGLLYHYEYKSGCENDCWVIVKTIPSDEDVGQSVEEADCLKNAYYPSVENFVDSKSFCYWYAPQVIVYINTIDKDGTVYFWGNARGEDGMWILAVSFFGGVAGFIIGLIVVLLRLFFDWIELVQEKATKMNKLQG
jgi:hypothetical protein